jgi:hypothetical protein
MRGAFEDQVGLFFRRLLVACAAIAQFGGVDRRPAGDLIAGLYSRDQVITLEGGFDKDAKLTALSCVGSSARRALPKYSPDLNPIEQAFAKLKHLLRNARARTVAAICTTIREQLGSFTPSECANYFKNAGYGLT